MKGEEEMAKKQQKTKLQKLQKEFDNAVKNEAELPSIMEMSAKYGVAPSSIKAQLKRSYNGAIPKNKKSANTKNVLVIDFLKSAMEQNLHITEDDVALIFSISTKRLKEILSQNNFSFDQIVDVEYYNDEVCFKIAEYISDKIENKEVFDLISIIKELKVGLKDIHHAISEYGLEIPKGFFNRRLKPFWDLIKNNQYSNIASIYNDAKTVLNLNKNELDQLLSKSGVSMAYVFNVYCLKQSPVVNNNPAPMVTEKVVEQHKEVGVIDTVEEDNDTLFRTMPDIFDMAMYQLKTNDRLNILAIYKKYNCCTQYRLRAIMNKFKKIVDMDISYPTIIRKAIDQYDTCSTINIDQIANELKISEDTVKEFLEIIGYLDYNNSKNIDTAKTTIQVEVKEVEEPILRSVIVNSDEIIEEPLYISNRVSLLKPNNNDNYYPDNFIFTVNDANKGEEAIVNIIKTKINELTKDNKRLEIFVDEYNETSVILNTLLVKTILTEITDTSISLIMYQAGERRSVTLTDKYTVPTVFKDCTELVMLKKQKNEAINANSFYAIIYNSKWFVANDKETLNDKFKTLVTNAVMSPERSFIRMIQNVRDDVTVISEFVNN